MKIKVLHYIPGFNYGGIESRLLDWYKNIDRSQIQFDILKQTTDDDNVLLKEFKQLGGNVYTLPKLSLKTFHHYKRELKVFFDKHNYYKVVHCHSTLGYHLLKEAKKNSIPVRIIHSRTTSFNPGEKQIIMKKIFNKLVPIYATDYFACSKEAGEWVFSNKTIKSDKFKVINNGIEADQFKFNMHKRNDLREKLCIHDEFVIGNVARFSPQKNHEFIIDIFVEVLEKHKNSKLMFVGDGPTEILVKNKLSKLDIEDKVLFLGRQNNIADYLQAMDVFLFPSHFEGFGTVAIEAQAAGLNCIVSNGVPNSVDITQLIEHVSLLDNPKQWADKILKFADGYERKNMYQQISNAGYDVKSTAEWLESFYLESIK